MIQQAQESKRTTNGRGGIYLEERVDHLESLVIQLDQQKVAPKILDLHDRLASLNLRHSALQEQTDGLQRRVGDFDLGPILHRVEELYGHLEALSRIGRFEQQLWQLQNAAEALRREAERLGNQDGLLENSINVLRQDLDLVSRHSGHWLDNADALRRETERLARQDDLIQNGVEVLRHEIEVVLHQSQGWRQTTEALRQELEQWATRDEAHRAALGSLRTEVEAVSTREASLRQDADRLRADLREEVEKLGKQDGQSRSVTEVLRGEIERLGQQDGQLQAATELLHEEIDRVGQRHQSLLQAINILRGEHDKLAQSVAPWVGGLDTMRGELERVSHRQAGCQEQVSTLLRRINEWSTDHLEQRLTELTSQLARLDRRDNTMQTALESLRADLERNHGGPSADQWRAWSGQLSGFEQRLAGLDGRFSQFVSIEQRVVGLDGRLGRITEIEQRVVGLDGRLGRITEIEQRVTALDTRLNQVGTWEQRFATLDGRLNQVTQFDQRLNALQERLAQWGNIDTLRQALTEQHQRWAALDEKGQSLRQSLGTCQQDLQKLTHQHQELQNTVGHHVQKTQTGLGQLKAEVDALRQTSAAALDTSDFRQQLQEQQKQVHRLDAQKGQLQIAVERLEKDLERFHKEHGWVRERASVLQTIVAQFDGPWREDFRRLEDRFGLYESARAKMQATLSALEEASTRPHPPPAPPPLPPPPPPPPPPAPHGPTLAQMEEMRRKLEALEQWQAQVTAQQPKGPARPNHSVWVFRLALLAFILSGLGITGASMVGASVAKMRQQVASERFQLLDNSGRARAELVALPDASGLVLMDADGVARLRVAVSSEGPHLEMLDRAGKQAVRVLVGRDGSGVQLQDSAGNTRAALAMAGEEPMLEFTSGLDKQRIRLGANRDGAGLVVDDRSGRTRVQVGLTSDEPHLTLLDDQGEPRARLAGTSLGAELRMHDSRGRRRLVLVSQSTGATLAMADEQGKERAHLAVTQDGSPLLSLRDADLEPRLLLDGGNLPKVELLGSADGKMVSIHATKEGGAIRLHDEKFRPRLLLATPASGQAMTLLDPAGKTRVGLGYNEEGAALNLFDSEQRRRVMLSEGRQGVGLGVLGPDSQPRATLGITTQGEAVLNLHDSKGTQRAILDVADDRPHLKLLESDKRPLFLAPEK